MVRPYCSASTADPTSMVCTAASTTTRCSFTPSIFSPCRARTCDHYRCIFARTIWRGCWRAVLMASSFPTSNRVRSGRICSGTAAQWASRAWFQSTASDRAAAVAHHTGSRSKTAHTTLLSASKKHFPDRRPTYQIWGREHGECGKLYIAKPGPKRTRTPGAGRRSWGP